jgi:uncharacterized protein YggU (UPF0235/DUF167 family)
VFRDGPNGASATIRVTPRAGHTAFAGVREGTIFVRLSAAPVEGAANDALLTFLAESLRLPKRSITIVAGERSRTKRVVVAGAPASDVNHRLAPLLGQR